MVDYKSHIRQPLHKAKRTILLKGPSGTGKTYQFRLLLESGLKGLYVWADEHTGTLEGLDYPEWPIVKVDIPLTPSAKRPEEQDFILLMDFLRSDQHEYDFVFFDSLMGFAESLQNYIENTMRLRGFEMWGAFGKKMRQAIKLLVSLARPIHPKPLHVIATWGVEVAQDWEGKRAIVPIVDGKMVGPRIDYYFDDVLMLKKREDPDDGTIKYLAYTQGTHEFDAKVSSASVKLPAVWESPDLAKMLAKFKQAKGSK